MSLKQILLHKKVTMKQQQSKICWGWHAERFFFFFVLLNTKLPRVDITTCMNAEIGQDLNINY